MTAPLFITLEGIEGVGKSTHLGFVTECLRQRGRTVVQTREPGGTPLGEGIRTILLDHRYAGMSTDAELLLVFAARAEHLDKVIRPALSDGTDVVCDRFTDASFAYQGGGRGAATERIVALESFVQQGLQPDFTLLFDVPVTVAMARAKARDGTDRFESESSEFFERVRSAYLQRAHKEPGRFRLIDASGSLEQVRQAIVSVLDDVITR
jgi:dTMP kinase